MGNIMTDKVINTCVINDDNVLPYVGNDTCNENFFELSTRRRLCPCEVRNVSTRCFCGWIKDDKCELPADFTVGLTSMNCATMVSRLISTGYEVLAGQWKTICDLRTYATLEDLSTVEQAFQLTIDAHGAIDDPTCDEHEVCAPTTL